MSKAAERLREVQTFPQLVKYLRDQLDWPIEQYDFDELTFEYSAEELGIDAVNAAKVEYIKQLRPLTSTQPWGIFFVKFAPSRLQVTALRRILNELAIKKRANAKVAERQTWHAGDLLFISSYGDDDDRLISLAHFSQQVGRDDLPTLKVLGWDNLDTPLHLDDVADKLEQKLGWPDHPEDAAAWREAWSSAFTLRPRQVIATSKELSIRLADVARAIRDRLETTLAIETDRGPLTKLMKAFQEALIHDLDAETFADMYAQTITYGLLSARIADPHKKTADDFAAHMRTNPFLRELMQTFLKVGGRRGTAGGPGIDFDELGVSEVVELLDDADMEAVVRDFGDRKPQEDPVIHFYEGFAKEYDPIDKVRRGEFYTPQPVVSYIVRSVDELLRSEFGLEDGLADTSTWGDMVNLHKGLKIPEGITPDQTFVQILDPATGTGTFLVEVIDLVHTTLVAKWRKQGQGDKQIEESWNEFVPTHLLPRLFAYELKMAPYAIAHLRIGLKLHETGYLFGSDERARIYLTNALEPAADTTQLGLEGLLPALAHEARAVNKVKRSQRFTVIIGNPPYANYSANLSAQARRIVDKYRSFHGVPIRERNQLQFERNIQDDFVKFTSVAQDIVGEAGVGVFSYITNGTMLGSTSLRGMREALLRQFSRLFELNLHGGLNEIAVGMEDDENVFDIAQSVAIHIYVRLMPGGTSEVSYADLLGRRSAKYAALASDSVARTDWRRTHPDGENCGFTPQDEGVAGPVRRLDSIFVKYGAGIKTNRDAVAIGFNDTSLLETVREFDAKLVDGGNAQSNIHSLLYRPFDFRRIFYHQDTVASRSLPTMKHVLAGPNIGFVSSSTWTTPERFSVGVSRLMVEMKTGTHDRGTTFFPLYRYESLLGGEAEKVHNLTQEFTNRLRASTKTRFVSVGRGDDENTTGPEDVLFFLYGLFHSPEYRRRYRTALSQGFPIVLLASNLDLFRALARLGGDLVALHLMESPKLNHPVTTYSGPKNPEVERVGWSDNTVWLDAAATKKGQPSTAGTIGFRGVPEAVWNLHIGGYQVCEKWLKDRKGRKLLKADIEHYQKIVVAIGETIRLMAEIDEVIEAHGGWPGAFSVAG